MALLASDCWLRLLWLLHILWRKLQQCRMIIFTLESFTAVLLLGAFHSSGAVVWLFCGKLIYSWNQARLNKSVCIVCLVRMYANLVLVLVVLLASSLGVLGSCRTALCVCNLSFMWMGW